MASNLGFTAYSGNEKYAFLAYLNCEKEKVSAFATALYNADIRIWYDNGLTPGRLWESQIVENIINSSVVFFLITQKTISKVDEHQYLWHEFELAKREGKRIVPVFLEKTDAKTLSNRELLFYTDLMKFQGIVAYDLDYSQCVSIIKKTFPEIYKTDSSTKNELSDYSTQNQAGDNYSTEIILADKPNIIKKILSSKVVLPLVEFLIVFSLVTLLHNGSLDLSFIYQIAERTGFFRFSDIIDFVCALVGALLGNLSIIRIVKRILNEYLPSGINYSQEELMKTEMVNRKTTRKIISLGFLPIILLTIVYYLLPFLFMKSSKINSVYAIGFFSLEIVSSLMFIHLTIYIKKYLIKSDNKITTIAKFVCLIIFLLNVVGIFSILTYAVYLGNPNSYTSFSYSSWYECAFAFFYHSFSMCFRFESDISTPLNMLSRSISMIQTIAWYFIISVQAIDILSIGKKKSDDN